jgi:hypothetical protein
MRRWQKIVFFCISLLTLHFLCIWGFRKYAFKHSSLVEYHVNYIRLEKPPRFLFVGDSHVMRSIRKRDIPRAYKLSHYGEGPILTYFRVKHLLEKLKKKPEYIFIQGDITRFSGNYLRHSENHFFYSKSVDYLQLLEEGIIDWETYMKYRMYRYFPYIEWRRLIKKNKRAKVEKDESKFEDWPDNIKQLSTEMFVQGRVLNGNCDILFYEPAFRYLVRLIELCQKHEVKVIAVKFPVTDYYLNAVSDLCGLDAVHSPHQDTIFRKYGIPIWDFEHAFEKRYDLFFDSHHMNRYGKDEFTKLIRATIQDSILNPESIRQKKR